MPVQAVPFPDDFGPFAAIWGEDFGPDGTQVYLQTRKPVTNVTGDQDATFVVNGVTCNPTGIGFQHSFLYYGSDTPITEAHATITYGPDFVITYADGSTDTGPLTVAFDAWYLFV